MFDYIENNYKMLLFPKSCNLLLINAVYFRFLFSETRRHMSINKINKLILLKSNLRDI